MKSKIMHRLVGYFSIILLLFAFIVGILYLFLFSGHTIEINKQSLKDRAVSISDKLSDFIQHEKGTNSKQGYGAYIKSLNDIAIGDIWIVDRKAKTIDLGYGNQTLSYEELPKEASGLIETVFEGEVAINEYFSGFFQSPAITAGAPIYDKEGKVVAAVLLHADVSGMNHGIIDGIKILLLALICALIASFFGAIMLAKRFIKPLKCIEETTKKLTNGIYTARTDINQNDEIGAVASNMDILAERLQIAENRRRKYDKMQQDFIATVSHELRTPVTVIRGSLELLHDGVIKSDEMKEYFGHMLNDSIHLQRLVNDLLELSKLQNEDYIMETTEVNIIEVLEDSIRSLRGLAMEKDLKILVKNNIQQYMMYGDYGRLRQMFIIVFDNAIKFSDNGNHIDVNCNELQEGICIEIKDYGIGIASKDLEHIFEKFYHVDNAKNKSGSGLGLTIAKKIAQRHGFMLKCQSLENKYTTFCFIRKNK